MHRHSYGNQPRSTRILVTWIVLVLCCTTDVYGQSDSEGYADLITNVHARDGMTLNGAWHTIVDPYENGYYNYRYEPFGPGAGYAANQHPQHEGHLVEYAFDQSPTLQVPGDWNSQREALGWYEGTIWYERDFDYTLPPGRRLFVHVGAANYEAIAWINGQQLGRHVGGFTPFQFEVTDLVRSDTTNSLVLKVDNRREREAVPTMNTDWWNYGGLTRDVRLVEVPATFVKDYFVQLDSERPDQIAGWIQLDGPEAAGATVEVAIPAVGISEAVTTDATGRADLRMEAGTLQRWTPDNPARYHVTIESPADRVTDRIGFRTVETRGTQIVLNGKPVFLRGVSVHEEAPFRAGRAYSEADAHTLLGWVKAMNGNYARLAHYPHNEHMVRAADSLGVMLWAEIPVYWTILWDDPSTYANAETQLREMVTRDKNRASVLLWSLGNETPLSDSRLRFMRRLAETARSLDATRLITAALERHYTEPYTLMVDDPLGAALDVLGVNEYVGWYDGLPPKIDSLAWRTVYDKPMIISEFGAGALQGYRGPETTIWTEDFQADLYRRTVSMLDEVPFLAGTSPWILMDFRSPRRPLPGIQDYWNRKGLISDRGIPKEAFQVMKDWYARKAQN